MRSVVDQDHPVLERWADMADADTSVVFDAHIAGIPVCVIGIESRVIPRKGWVPADGPDQWTSGTLFPQSSKKTARAINAASGNRPLVVLANLSGFDGSPESLRRLQLELRRRNRPGHRQLRRTDRVRRDLALSRRSLRGLLRRAEREHGSARSRGIVLLGDRRCTRGSGGVHPRREQTYRSRPGRARPRSAACRQHGRRRKRPPASESSPTPGPRYVRTSSARWQRSSKPCTTWSARARWVPSTRSFRRRNCARASSPRWSVGWLELEERGH